MIGHMVVPAILIALADALPTRAIAEGADNSSISVNGEQDGRPDYKFRAGSVSPYWIEVPLLWLLARHVQGLVPTEKRRPAAS